MTISLEQSRNTEAAPIAARPPSPDAPRCAPRQGRFSSGNTVRLDGPVTAEDLPGLLVAHDAVTLDQVQCAMAIQRDTGGQLGEILIDEGFISEVDFIAFLAKHCRIPHLSLRGYAFDETLLSAVPRDLCLKYQLVPIDKLGSHMTLAMVNPLDGEALGAVRQRCASLVIRPVLCTRRQFDMVVKRVIDRRRSLVDSSNLCRRRTDSSPRSESAPDLDRTQRSICPSPPAAAGPAPGPAAAAPPPPVPHNVLDFVEHPVDHRKPHATAPHSDTFPAVPAAKELPAAPTPAMISAMRATFLAIHRDTPLFRGLAAETAAHIMARARFVEASEGTILPCRMGERDAVYVLLAGEAVCRDAAGRAHSVAPGQIITHIADADDAARPLSLQITHRACFLALSLFEITAHLPSECVTRLMLNIASRRVETDPPRTA